MGQRAAHLGAVPTGQLKEEVGCLGLTQLPASLRSQYAKRTYIRKFWDKATWMEGHGLDPGSEGLTV